MAKVLICGIYLADKENCAADAIEEILERDALGLLGVRS